MQSLAHNLSSFCQRAVFKLRPGTVNMTAAAKYAGAVGALTVARAGTIASLPTREEVDAFLKSNRIR